MFTVVVAMHAESRGIGRGGTIPWRCKEDMRRFKEMTWGGVVIMGRKTFESLPPKSRPLPGRLNIVLSTTMPPPPPSRTDADATTGLQGPAPALFARSLEDALRVADEDPNWRGAPLFVIGGERVYKEALAHDRCGAVRVTEIHCALDGPCDAFFPLIPADRFRREPCDRCSTDGDVHLYDFVDFISLN